MKMTFRNDDPLPRTWGNTRNVKRAFLVAWGQYFGGTNDIIRMIHKLILRLNGGWRRRIHKFENGRESDSLTHFPTTRSLSISVDTTTALRRNDAVVRTCSCWMGYEMMIK